MTDKEIINFVNDPVKHIRQDIRRGKGLQWIVRLALGAVAGVAILAGICGFVCLLAIL